MLYEAEEVTQLDPANFVDIDLEGDELRQNWLKIVTDWGQRRPFYVRDRHGRVRVVCGRYADVREIQMDRKRFSSALPSDSGSEVFDIFMGISNVAQMDGDEHDRVRRLLSRVFSPQRVLALEKSIEQVVGEMLDDVKARGDGHFEAMSDFCSHLIARIIFESMLGMTREQVVPFYNINKALPLVSDIAPGQAFPEQYVEAFNGAVASISNLVEERRARPKSDFVSALAEAQEGDDRLTSEELVGNIFAIAAGGLTTTSVSLGMALYNLCRHRDQLAALQANPSLIPTALEECLRYQGPGYITFARFALEDCEIGGTFIPKNSPVELSQAGANFDPLRYPDPTRFDIFRDPKGIATFGGGPHLCVGFRVARAIMRIALANILRRFPNIRLADPDFVPTYHGMRGEIAPDVIPLRID